MTLKNTILSALTAFMAFSLFSCNQDDDTNAPSIDSMLVNGVDQLGIVILAAGNDLTISATINDDVELASYRFQVVADFGATAPFSYDQTTNVSGTTTTINETITIPGNTTAGPYSIILSGVDVAGNESGEATVEVFVTSATQANIDLTLPASGSSLTFSFGDTIFVAGTVTDDTDLTSIDVVVSPVQMQGGLSGAGGPFYEATVTLGGASDTTWDIAEVQNLQGHIIIPPGVSTGSYELRIEATDSDENVAVTTVDLSIF